MNKGQIEQIGAPEEVYDPPVTPFVHHFLSRTNISHGRVDRGRVRIGAVISHIRPAGPTVRLDLKIPETSERIEVDMSKERYRELTLKVNDIVFIRFRTLRVYREEEKDSNN